MLCLGTVFLWLAIALCSCRPVSGASLLDWIGLGSESSDRRDLTVQDGVPLLKVHFEETSPEDKFLQEAEKFINLKKSELDKCQHKVVLRIHSSCGALSDEDLAKLSVNLLNCQTAVEGRQQFPCTEDMPLRDCTKDMDSDMWNTYHLMNNRARAVCFSAKHQQFRALSEMTVNKLMTAAHEQLQSMDLLKDGQLKLESLTSNAMDSVSKGHQALMIEQEKLQSSTQSVHEFVALNLRELTREKALIAAGQRELSLMTKDVKSKLDMASKQLSDQATERDKNHVQVLADLEALQLKTFDIWERVDSSTNQILAQHAAAAKDIDHMLENLAKINSSIEYLLKTVEKTRSEIDDRLGWIVKFMSESGNQVEWIQQCLGHGLYLVLSMVATSFVQAPFAVRCAVLVVVPLNLMLSSYEGSEGALDFPGITILLCAFAVAHWLLSSLQAVIYPSQAHAVHYISRNPPPQAQVTVASSICNGTSNNSTPTESYSSLQSLWIWCKKTLNQCQWHSFKSKVWNVYEQSLSWFSITREVQLPQSHSEGPNLIHSINREPIISSDEEDEEGSIHEELGFVPQPSSAFRRFPVGVPRSDSPASSRSSRSLTPLLSGSPKLQCGGFTKTGQQCRKSAQVGSLLCRTHGLASPSRG